MLKIDRGKGMNMGVTASMGNEYMWMTVEGDAAGQHAVPHSPRSSTGNTMQSS